MKRIIIALALLALAPLVQAQTNLIDAAVPATNLAANAVINPGLSLIAAIEQNGHVSAGPEVDFKGHTAPSISQQIDLMGFGSTNRWVHLGFDHNTFFRPNENQDQLGVFASAHWDKPWKFLRFMMFNADNVTASIELNGRTETVVHAFKSTHPEDFGVTASIGRGFGP